MIWKPREKKVSSGREQIPELKICKIYLWSKSQTKQSDISLSRCSHHVFLQKNNDQFWAHQCLAKSKNGKTDFLKDCSRTDSVFSLELHRLLEWPTSNQTFKCQNVFFLLKCSDGWNNVLSTRGTIHDQSKEKIFSFHFRPGPSDYNDDDVDVGIADAFACI